MSRPFPPAVGFFLLGQAVFYVFVAVEIAARPAGLVRNHGLCYYELFRNTTPLYVMGLIIAGLLHFQAIRLLPVKDKLSGAVSTMFQWMGVCLIGMICAPIVLGKWLGYIHVLFGSSLFVLQLGLAVRLFVGSRSGAAAGLLGLQFLSGLVCILSLVHRLAYQIEGQIVFQIAFGLQMLKYLLTTGASPA